MKKQFRIKKSKEIDAIIQKRQSYGNKFFVIYYKTSENDYLRLSISIGRKYGNAVKRNLIKRQIRSVFREHTGVSNIDTVVVVKPQASKLKFQEIKKHLENLISKVKEKEKINGSNS